MPAIKGIIANLKKNKIIFLKNKFKFKKSGKKKITVVGKKEKTNMLMTKTIIIKLVPHLICKVEYFLTFFTVSFFPASKQLTALCSAPWYWNNLLTSFKKEIAKIYSKKNAIRIRPSTRLKIIG
ncbi:unnamed protein product, partial [marine sediment metagenome]